MFSCTALHIIHVSCLSLCFQEVATFLFFSPVWLMSWNENEITISQYHRDCFLSTLLHVEFRMIPYMREIQKHLTNWNRTACYWEQWEPMTGTGQWSCTLLEEPLFRGRPRSTTRRLRPGTKASLGTSVSSLFNAQRHILSMLRSSVSSSRVFLE